MSYPANVTFEGDYLKLNRKIGKVYCRRHRDLVSDIYEDITQRNE